MTITSAGYKGQVGEADWAKIAANPVGWFESTTDFVPSAVAGARQVSIAAGGCVQSGVRVVSDAPVVSTVFPTPANGQWYLAVVDRNWDPATRASSVVFLTGAVAASPTAPNVPPTAIPGTWYSSPGIRSYQPIAWLFVSSSTAVVTIYDLRIRALATALRMSGISMHALNFLLATGGAGAPAGSLMPCDADGITYRSNGPTWKAWDSDWKTVALSTTNVAITMTAAYRYRAGRVLLRFYGSETANANNGGAVTLGGLPAPRDAAAGLAPLPNGSAFVANAATTWPCTVDFVDSTTLNFFTSSGSPASRVPVTTASPYAWDTNGRLYGELEYDPA